tara:strand:+ start:242 stop:967 length:726 start_codon:yes stop_codon:yes gene_type:complete
MKHRVYYCPEHFENTEITTENFQNHKGYSYTNCPVWNHRFNRTLIGSAPCNFSMGILNNILRYNVDDEVIQINLNDLDEDYEDDYIQFSLSDLDKEQPVIQLLFPSIHIWADFQDEYMWYEFLDHPLTAVNNNYTAIGGWFNIANHPRSTSLAVRFYDKSKIIKFKKGDPLYRIRFYTKDMNDEVSFIKKSSSKINLEAKKDMMNERRKLLGEDSQLMNQILFDKDSRKKCPFHYNNFENV